MALRTYANAPASTLAEACTNVQTTIVVASTTGLPITYPFILIVDRGTAQEEVVLCTNASGTTLNVTRGYDNTTAFAHAFGAEVVHGISAIDPREANAHVNATDGVHGVTGDIVGTTDTQTLTNKTIDIDSNTVNGLAASSFVTTDGSGEIDGAASKAVPSGTVVGTTDTQTLTNKTISVASNTVSGMTASRFAESNASGHLSSTPSKAVPTGAVVGTTDTQTLTNKTLTSETNVFPALGLIAQLTYASNGTFQKANYPLMKAVRVRVVGGGGGGGNAGTTGSGEAAVGSGGGAGGYAEKFIAVGSLSASETVTVGTGGAAASNGNLSSFGAHCTGNGGTAGGTDSGGAAAVSTDGGAGGSATGGDINVSGGPGGTSFRPASAPGAAFSGAGGSSFFGAGGASRATSSTGAVGGGYGAGGSGAKNGASEFTKNGGIGSQGVVIVEVYG